MTETYSPSLIAPDRILARELEDTARRLTLVDSERESGFGRVAAPVSVRVYAADPISQLGIMAHLRHYREICVVEDDEPASVAVAIADNLDEDRIRWLRSLHRDNGVSIVLIAGHIDPRTLVTAVEAGVCAVIGRLTSRRRARPRHPGRLARRRRAAAAAAATPARPGRTAQPPVCASPTDCPSPGLTKRERDVLGLVAEGL